MPANPNWSRWIMSSVAQVFKDEADNLGIESLIEGIEDRDDPLMQASDRVEIRVNGPFIQEQSRNYWRIRVDINLEITSHLSNNDAYAMERYAGAFQALMSRKISIFRYGTGVDDDETLLGCLAPRSGPNDEIRDINFGQVNRVTEIRQAQVDARYVMYLCE